jgi:DNA-binding MarR family transcriptional regulator
MIAELVEEFLRRLCSGAGTSSMAAFADIDLSFSQVRMLMVLAYVGRALPINRIAEHLCLTLPSAGRNVERLLREGLVEREEDPHDRRVKLVQLTPAGRDLVSQHFECHRLMLADFTQRLPEADRIRIAAALTPVLENELLLPEPPALAAAPDSSGLTVRQATR